MYNMPEIYKNTIFNLSIILANDYAVFLNSFPIFFDFYSNKQNPNLVFSLSCFPKNPRL